MHRNANTDHAIRRLDHKYSHIIKRIQSIAPSDEKPIAAGGEMIKYILLVKCDSSYNSFNTVANNGRLSIKRNGDIFTVKKQANANINRGLYIFRRGNSFYILSDAIDSIGLCVYAYIGDSHDLDDILGTKADGMYSNANIDMASIKGTIDGIRSDTLYRFFGSGQEDDLASYLNDIVGSGGTDDYNVIMLYTEQS